MAFKNEKLASALEKSFSSFAKLHVGTGVIMSVTDLKVSGDLKKADVFVNVFPESKEAEAIENVKNNLGKIKNHIKKTAKVGTIPTFHIKPDRREKLQQKIAKDLGIEMA